MRKPNILYEDNHILVCVKPTGILSQSAGNQRQDMLTWIKDFIKERDQKPGNVFLGLVHRLDSNVGGVMVFAKTSKGASRLSESIREHHFEKRYLALVEGNLEGHGELEHFLDKDEQRLMSVESTSQIGKKSRLSYQVLAHHALQGRPISLIDVHLETGRFHQIRSQFSLVGHPLVGDQKYGSSFPQLPLALWAYRLQFPHPISKEPCIFTSEVEIDGIPSFLWK